MTATWRLGARYYVNEGAELKYFNSEIHSSGCLCLEVFEEVNTG